MTNERNHGWITTHREDVESDSGNMISPPPHSYNWHHFSTDGRWTSTLGNTFSLLQYSWTKSTINLATEFGLSTWGRWPQSDIWCIFAFGSSHCSLCTMHQRHVCVCIYIYICHGLSLPWITNQSDSFTMLLQTTKNPGYTLKKTVCVTEKPLPAPPPQVMGPLKFLTTNT